MLHRGRAKDRLRACRGTQIVGYREGDKVGLMLGVPAKGEVVVRPMHSVAESTHGAVKPRQQPEDWDELCRRLENEWTDEAAAENEPANEP